MRALHRGLILLLSLPSLLDAQSLAFERITALPAYRQIGDCTAITSRDVPCRLTTLPTSRELDRRLAHGGTAAWADGEQWYIAYRDTAAVAATGVTVMGGIQLPLAKLRERRDWLLALRLPGLDSAAIALGLVIERGDAIVQDTMPAQWRGPKARRRVHAPPPFAGRIGADTIWSEALQMKRRVYWYVPAGPRPANGWPVVYLADGADMAFQAAYIDPLIRRGKLPPVVLVGIATSGVKGRGSPFEDERGWEYHATMASAIPDSALAAKVADRFARHRRFFVDEVSAWAEAMLHVSSRREDRAINGCSNGGAFAAFIGTHEAARYGAVFPFSPTGSVGPRPDGIGTQWWYLIAGRAEPGVLRIARTITDSLAAWGAPHEILVHGSGHDGLVWSERLGEAIGWWRRGTVAEARVASRSAAGR